MKTILVINAHEYYPFPEGGLNNVLAARALRHVTTFPALTHI